jgi:hypothetical protein
MIRAVVVAGIIDHQCLTFPFHYTHSNTGIMFYEPLFSFETIKGKRYKLALLI